MSDEILIQPSESLLHDTREIIESAQRVAYKSVDRVLVLRNWLLGKRISEEKMTGTRVDRYGAKIIAGLAVELGKLYGKGFDRTALYRYVKFYHLYPEIVGTASQQSVLHGSEQLFASKYRLCLPSEEQLRSEIAAQKEIFYLQHPELRED